jgi:ABC-type uncharacterized transport system auxiliary subunit
MRLPCVATVFLVCSACLPAARVAEPRYFTPNLPEAEVLEPRPTTGPLVRLRRVQAAVHLKERIVWRRSNVEFGFHELDRWTQPPAHLVAQRLARELFERRSLRRALTGAYPTLEVEVRAFDEVVAPQRSARVELAVRLTDPRGISLHERTYAVERELASRDASALARSMGEALAEAISRIGDDIEGAL